MGHASEARSSPLDQEGSDFLTKLRRDAQRRLQVIYHRLPFLGAVKHLYPHLAFRVIRVILGEIEPLLEWRLSIGAIIYRNTKTCGTQRRHGMFAAVKLPRL